MIPVAAASYFHAGCASPEDKYQSLRTDRMATQDLAQGVIFLVQTVLGILGNFSLLYLYVLLSLTGCRPRPTDLFVKDLIVANLLVMVSFGIHRTLSSFGWCHILSDFGCKFSLHVRGVFRGVSIGGTCLLGVIMISPQNSRWAALKGKALQCLVPSLVLCWVLQILVTVMYPMFMSSPLNYKNITSKKGFGYCSTVRHNKAEDSLFAALSFPDVLFLGLMIWFSGSIVLILYRHKQRVQHIHLTSVSSTSSSESTATKTILLLVSTFVYFNTLFSIFHIVLSLFYDLKWYLLINNLFSNHSVFSNCQPFLFLSGDPRISMICFPWLRNIKSPHLMRNM
ncbi:vomeronasal type-1 receptor 4-like [Crocuta crocuta]